MSGLKLKSQDFMWTETGKKYKKIKTFDLSDKYIRSYYFNIFEQYFFKNFYCELHAFFFLDISVSVSYFHWRVNINCLFHLMPNSEESRPREQSPFPGGTLLYKLWFQR